jgi:hypothetical protein
MIAKEVWVSDLLCKGNCGQERSTILPYAISQGMERVGEIQLHLGAASIVKPHNCVCGLTLMPDWNDQTQPHLHNTPIGLQCMHSPCTPAQQ